MAGNRLRRGLLVLSASHRLLVVVLVKHKFLTGADVQWAHMDALCRGERVGSARHSVF